MDNVQNCDSYKFMGLFFTVDIFSAYREISLLWRTKEVSYRHYKNPSLTLFRVHINPAHFLEIIYPKTKLTYSLDFLFAVLKIHFFSWGYSAKGSHAFFRTRPWCHYAGVWSVRLQVTDALRREALMAENDAKEGKEKRASYQQM
jgi:hypothetical protein